MVKSFKEHKMIAKIIEKTVGADIGNVSMSRIGVGDINDCYLFTCEKKSYFLKIQNKTNLPHLYERQIERDVLASAICKNVGIPCPDILAYDFSDGYVITEFIEYELLKDLWSSITNDQQTYIKTQALEYVKKMSSYKCGKYGALYLNGNIIQSDDWLTVYQNYTDIAIKDCLHFGTLCATEAIKIRRRIDDNCGKLCLAKTPSPSFCHLDFHWNNVFVDKKTMKLKHIFDFGSSMFAPDYMNYYRLDGGFLYGTEHFFNESFPCPQELSKAETECAFLCNTLDYLVFLSYKGYDCAHEKNALLEELN